MPHRAVAPPLALHPNPENKNRTNNIMNSSKYTLGSLAAAIVLLLSSCGDGNSSTGGPEESSGEPPAATTATYPLDVCVVSGEKLGSMGDPVVVNHEGTELRFCCKECLPEFNKNPGKYVSMVKAGKAGKMDHSGHNN
jgi:YHS domain-containing protein